MAEEPDNLVGATMQQSVAMVTTGVALGMTMATQAFGFWVGMAGAMSAYAQRSYSSTSPTTADKARERTEDVSKPSSARAAEVRSTAATPTRKPNVVTLRPGRAHVEGSPQVAPKRSTGASAIKSNPILDAVAEAQEAVSPAARDDLKAISGIGPKLEKVLNDEGILTYSQLAALPAQDVASLEGKFGMEGRLDRDDWLGQAKSLAGGAYQGRSAPQGTSSNG